LGHTYDKWEIRKGIKKIIVWVQNKNKKEANKS
jgi:hypothetical protein